MAAFFRNLLATLVGLCIFAFFGISFLIAIVSLSGQQQRIPISENSILHLKLNKPILETEKDNPFGELEFIPGQSQGNIGLKELTDAIKYAKTDDNIEGIYLETPFVFAGSATKKAIREALKDFKSSGKFVISHADIYTEGGYYVASASDEIYLHPIGNFEMNGLSANVTYFKDLFDKIGVQPEIFRVGKFKSAVEPFFRTSMSEASRLQTESFLNSINGIYLNEISSSRNIKVGELKEIIDSLLVRTPEDAVRLKLVDGLAYQDQITNILRKKVNLESEDDKLKLVSYRKYKKSIIKDNSNKDLDKIAVIVAQGEIIYGKSHDDKVGSTTISEEIRKARKDDDVKAIILRVNSPGGSMLGSDIIWREIELAKKEKPVIASMSDLAASGGYYISSGCDTIVAEPNTITGSIGIFGILFNAQELLNDKLGITFSTVKTAPFADMGSTTRPMTAEEKKIMQAQIDRGYEIFTSLVSKGRRMSIDRVKEYAEGRVWTGEQAQKRGLVDIIGGMNTAIDIAAQKAELGKGEYKVEFYPPSRTFFEELIQSYNDDTELALIQKHAGEYAPYIKQIKSMKEMKGIQARLPYILEID
ncbi:signal peptide peptidase SppA [Aureibacter tunicatorum]|uniref:Protease-4 n=1 Tax=Aureibacter tunicatorum TaxID=866807 RepID=A0AAE3XQT2_9BACT|nr:signal peptide peptidase SppA [Aureibacter tunicatorum]MDR6241053.1 protease-4 [Aureibacter tunicatorum]BDD03831.1 signal peptide peptidase SppA [Aureibacter tunicatorum]